MIDLGSGGGTSSVGVGSGSGADAGVADLCGGVVFLLLAACSTRAAARAGSFLFFSIAAASRSRCAKRTRVRHISVDVERVYSSVPMVGTSATRGRIVRMGETRVVALAEGVGDARNGRRLRGVLHVAIATLEE